MQKSVKLQRVLGIVVLCIAMILTSSCATLSAEPKEVPLVYDVEHTGAKFPAPAMPTIDELETVEPLTDPFLFSDGKSRVTRFSQWSKRRAEIKAELEHYEIGQKPPRPEDITATYENGNLIVKITVNGNTLTLNSRVSLPEGEGPFPAIIGIGMWGGGAGSLPADIFKSRNVATVSFNFAQVMAHAQNRGNEPINKLYPDQTDMGAYCAWPWGVSRLIDGLELVQDDLPIDLKRLAISGCSFAGKMALFCGAFDERIALTIAQEPGGGGAAAWRVSETLGNVETLGRTDGRWFKQSMFQYKEKNVAKLPMDHHELITMICPRAVLILGNADMVWLAGEAGYVSTRAAHEVWKQFGIGDRVGFSNVGGHGHCQLPAVQKPEVAAFVDKFLLGDMTVDTNIFTTPKYENVDYERWFKWWGTDKPVLAPKAN